jgi:hypothetical protein
MIMKTQAFTGRQVQSPILGRYGEVVGKGKALLQTFWAGFVRLALFSIPGRSYGPRKDSVRPLC